VNGFPNGNPFFVDGLSTYLNRR